MKTYLLRLLDVLLVVLVVAPFVMYAHNFGFGFWSEHADWAQMGDFFGGVYSPILALVTLIVLYAQQKSQKSMEEHQYDSWFLNSTKEDSMLLIDLIIERTSAPRNGTGGITVEAHLDQMLKLYEIREDDTEREEIFKNLIKPFCDNERRLLFAWISLHNLLDPLYDVDRAFYRQTAELIKTRLYSRLSFLTVRNIELICELDSGKKYCLHRE